MLSDMSIDRKNDSNLASRIIQKVRAVISKRKRKDVIEDMRLRLKNKEFSIISSNCIGGRLYHDLGLRFLSPTINLCFDGEDFIKFCENLQRCLDKDIEVLADERISCPLGRIDDIEIQFIHYKTVQEAYQKWNERKSRIKYDNLFIIATDRDGMARADLLERFDKLPYRKIMYTSKKYPQYDWAIYVPAFADKENVGIMTGWANINAVRYYEQQIDLVGWLNGEEESIRS